MLAGKAGSSVAPSASSSQRLSDVEIAVFGSRAHLEKQALATVSLLKPSLHDLCDFVSD